MTKTKSTKRALLLSALSLLMCVSMLIGSTFAWFTDSVTSSGNIIKSGKLEVGFQWAEGKEDPATATWTDVDGALFDYENWEPGYAVAKHLKVSNEGTLALNYQMRIVADGVITNLADVIDVYYFAEDKALERDDISDAAYLGTLTEVLGTNKNLSKTVRGALKAGDSADIHTLVLKMNEEAGNEYQEMDLGCTFSIELLATQMSDESDSFDNTYDDETKVPNAAVPKALVRPLAELDVSTNGPRNDAFGGIDLSQYSVNELDVGYQFEPTMSAEDALNSDYRYWHADFVVSADKTVAANSMALAGYYEEWCKLNDYKWIALSSSDAINANTEIRLVESMGVSVNWEEICTIGNDGKGLQCGAVDLTGGNVGTTLTAELRLYETYPQSHTEHNDGSECNLNSKNCETGKYITIGTFTYTFSYKVTNSEELAAAINAGKSSIELAPGEYVLPTMTAKQSDITIKGTDGAKITGNSNSQYKNITFENVEFTGTIKATFNGNCSVKNCTFTKAGLASSSYVAATATLTVEGCTFNGTGDNLSLHFGGKDGGTIIVKNCVFNKGGMAFGKAMNITFEDCDFNGTAIACYGSHTLNNCTFDADAQVYISAVTGATEVNLTMNGCSVDGGADVTSVCYNAGNSNGGVKTITIDGKVYNHDAMQEFPSN